jgi:hypothetical protein
MSSGFDWQTDDEYWEDRAKSRLNPPGRRRPSWVTILLIAVALALAGGFTYWFVNQRIEAATEVAKESVLAAHRLVRQAEKQADRELFLSTLAVENTPWAREQESLVALKARFNRMAFGFQDVSLEDGDGSEVTVALSPDLTTADVAFPLPYRVERGNGQEETHFLQQKAHYVREADRWLLSPPPVEFWGEWQMFDGRALTVIYRQGDSEVAERLATDLDTLVLDTCATLPNIRCSPTIHLRLRLENDFAPALTPSYRSELSNEGIDIRLPTPSLVGLPVDESGYRALLESYATFVATAAIRDSIGYRCCEYGQLYQALLDVQLHRLGLRPPLLSAEQYASLVSDVIHLRGLAALLPNEAALRPGKESWPYHALANFLVFDQNIPAADVQRAVVNTPEALPREIFERLSGGRFVGENELESAWVRFLQENAAPAAVEKPAFPREELQLACVSGNGEYTALVRYSPATTEWSQEGTLDGVSAFLFALPDQSGTLVSIEPGEVAGRIFLSQNGNEVPLLQSEDGIVPIAAFQEEPEGEESLLLVFNRRSRRYGWLSLEQCLGGGNCAVVDSDGYPLWSPDGSRQLLLVPSGSYGYESRFVRPFVLDSITGEIISTGKAPFWLDNDTVGFIRPAAQAAIAFNIPESSGRILFNFADLLEAGPGPEQLDQRALEIEYLAPNPSNADELLVVASDASRRSHFFTYSRGSGEVAYYDSSDIFLQRPVAYDFQYSPDGRWLLISGDDYTQGRAALYFYDVARRESYEVEYLSSYPMPMHWLYDWSSDGQWLAIPDSGYVRLINPAAGHQELFIPDSGYCTAAAWVTGSG